MTRLVLTLKLSAPVFLLIGVLHLILGVGADVSLGAELPPQALLDPTLDSQNRFYGVSFSLYGILLYLCATDLKKYAAVFQCVIWVFFAGGLARLVSMYTHGLPSPLVIGLLILELLLPPVLSIWYVRRVAES